MSDPDQSLTTVLVKSLAEEVARLLKPEFAKMSAPVIQPALFTVQEAAVYLGRSDRAIQHMIADRDLPVVRVGRRVHLNRRDLDHWIERNTY